MSKGIKKLAPFFAIILIISTVLSACGTSSQTAPSASAATTPSTTNSSPSASATASASAAASKAPSTAAVNSSPSISTAYNVGFNVWGTGVPVMDQFVAEGSYAFSVFGCKTTTASDDYTADKELSNIQNFCSAGLKGICMMGAAVATVPQMAQVCQNAKVPFVMYTQIGADADRDKIAANNPYYVGAIDSDMVAEGRTVADMAIESGCKKAVIIGGNIGDSNMDQRSQGFTDEFKAKGGTVLAEARCTDNTECPTKAEDMLSAHKDADCLYAMVGDYISGSISAIGNLGMTGKVKIYLSNVDKASAEAIKKGDVVGGSDGIVLASFLAPTLLVNYLDGHPIKDDAGKAPRFRTTPFRVTKDNVDAYMSVFVTEGVHAVADKVLQSLTWRYNPNVTYQTYVDTIKSGLTLNEILKAHNLPTVG